MVKKVEIGILWTLYKEMLTEKQAEIIDNYYNQDLTLSEIAENNQITRQAVRDIIKKAEKKLYECEEKLKILEKEETREKSKEKIIKEIEEIQKEIKEEEIRQKIEKMKGMIIDGI